MRCTRFRRTDQTGGEYKAEFDRLRRMVEPDMEMGAGFPGQLASMLRLDAAAQSLHEKSSIMASCHISLRFDDASADLRTLLGSRESGSRKDALLSEEAAEPHTGDEDWDVLAAYRKAKKQGAEKKRKAAPPIWGGGKVKGGGQTLNGFDRKTGLLKSARW